MEIRKVVFSNLPYPLPIMAQPYFERPTLELNLEAVCEIIPKSKLNDKELDELETQIGKKQQAVVDKTFDAKFTDALFKAASPKIQKIQKLIDAATKALNEQKGIPEAALQKIVDTVNKEIINFANDLSNTLETIANSTLEKAVASSFKDMQKRIAKAKAKCVGKVILKGLIKVSKKALDKLAQALVASGEFATLASFVGVLSKGLAIADSKINPHWPTTKQAIKAVDSASDAIAKDSASMEKLLVTAAPQKVGDEYYEVPPKLQDVFKGLVARVGGSTEAITKAVGQLDKFKGALLECYRDYVIKFNETVANIGELDKQAKAKVGKRAALVKSEAGKVNVKIAKLDQAAKDAADTLEAYRNLKASFDAFYGLKSPGDAKKQLGAIKGTLANFKQKVATVKRVLVETDFLDSAKRDLDSLKNTIASVT